MGKKATKLHSTKSGPKTYSVWHCTNMGWLMESATMRPLPVLVHSSFHHWRWQRRVPPKHRYAAYEWVDVTHHVATWWTFTRLRHNLGIKLLWVTPLQTWLEALVAIKCNKIFWGRPSASIQSSRWSSVSRIFSDSIIREWCDKRTNQPTTRKAN